MKQLLALIFSPQCPSSEVVAPVSRAGAAGTSNKTDGDATIIDMDDSDFTLIQIAWRQYEGKLEREESPDGTSSHATRCVSQAKLKSEKDTSLSSERITSEHKQILEGNRPKLMSPQ
ncbi:hypothetical protein BLNAU_4793 [Blattamonas nauphoetae]|uniref:Uncharacterized protein n=1 Tax=Blattamonas nauphoetae TaxID=2049346 RepID=A0ABQ9Y931_9EUKA|nr:hypothetical protein BLNAU_4793 [Blattamonas nauphoetae]